MNDQNQQNALSKCIRSKIIEAHDADEHAHNLTNWQQEYDQISRGAFYGNIMEFSLRNIQVFKEHTSQALNQKCKVWPDSIWLGISAEDGSVDNNSTNSKGIRINGLPVEHNTIMCRPGNHEFELTTPEAFDIFGIVVNRAALLEVAAIHGVTLNWQELNKHCRLNVPPKTLTALRFLLNRLLASQHSDTQKKLQHDVVMMALLEVLQKETPNQTINQSYQHRKTVVDTARQYLSRHTNNPVTMTELCEVTNVSRRTLQYSFETIMGISPLQYLRMSRLNAVRRALQHAVGEQTIADIAAQWGFWHLSQFSHDYKHLFGKLPSECFKC